MGLLCHKKAQNPLLSSSDIDETYSISKLSENFSLLPFAKTVQRGRGEVS
jgi:hypothetical protein